MDGLQKIIKLYENGVCMYAFSDKRVEGFHLILKSFLQLINMLFYTRYIGVNNLCHQLFISSRNLKNISNVCPEKYTLMQCLSSF